MKTEKWIVTRSTLLTIINKHLKIDDLVEWIPEKKALLFNGGGRYTGENAIEAWRQLNKLNEIGQTIMKPYVEPATIGETDGQKTSLLNVMPTMGMLVATERFLVEKGETFSISPVNKKQEYFMEKFGPHFNESNIPEMTSMADTDIAKVNKWILSQGFDIQLRRPGEFAVAAVMKLLLTWMSKGEKTKIGQTHNFNGYKGAALKSGYTVYMDKLIHKYFVLKIECRNGDTAYFSMWDTALETDSELFVAINRLKDIWKKQYSDKVSFPCIKFDKKEELSWLIGMKVNSDTYIAECKAQTKLDIDEEGAKIETINAAVMVKGSSSETHHIINKPFLFWVERKGHSVPMFAALLCRDTWVKL